MEFDACVIIAADGNSAADTARDWWQVAFLLTLTLPVAAVLLQTWRSVRETTLVVPLAWAVVAFSGAALLTLRAAAPGSTAPPSDFSAWQLVVACGTLCPLVALIGAKRPHHGAWSLVVLTLWGLLALPAAEVLFLQPGQALEINSLRSWFLMVLLFAELANFVFTRFSLAMLLLVAAQVSWLLPNLPLVPEGWKTVVDQGLRQAIGFWLLCAAIVLAWCLAWRRRPASATFDRLWFDFRDSFGLFWALKLIERVNDTAAQAEWDFDLGWTGFRTKSTFVPLGELPIEIAGPLRNSLQGLLRRFVSAEWIAARLNSSDNTASNPPGELP